MNSIFTIIGLLRKYDCKSMIRMLMGRVIKGITPGFSSLILMAFVDSLERAEFTYAIAYTVLFCVNVFGVWTINETENRDTMHMTALLRTGLQIENAGKINRVCLELLEDPIVQDIKQRVLNSGENYVVKGYKCILEVIEEAIAMVSLAILVGRYNIFIGFLVLVLDFPIIILAYHNGKKTYEENKEATVHRRYYSYLENILLSKEYVNERIVFDNYDFFHEKWKNEFESARKLEMKTFLKYFLSIRGATIVEILVIVLLLDIMGRTLWGSNATLFVALMGYMINLLQIQTQSLPFCISEYAKVVAYFDDRHTFFALGERGGQHLQKKNLAKKFYIELKNVRFRYPGSNTYAIDGVNMKLLSDENYAFVGKNGSGKTTLVRVLLGLYDGYEGNILIDGNEVRECSGEYLKEIFSMVFQEYAKYPLSVKENIQVANLKKNDGIDGRIKKILRDIGLHDLVHKLPQKEDTLLWKKGESYADLSRGQWQRMAIGRSLFSDASIKILDEPTAAIDPAQEKVFYEQYREICKEYGTILISHRLASVKSADTIFVFDQGKIVEQGKHEQLMEKKGIYYEMYRKQKSWYIEKTVPPVEDSVYG